MPNHNLLAIHDRIDEEHFEVRLHTQAIDALQRRVLELEAAVRELRGQMFTAVTFATDGQGEEDGIGNEAAAVADCGREPRASGARAKQLARGVHGNSLEFRVGRRPNRGKRGPVS